MELSYKGKKSVEQILQLAEQCDSNPDGVGPATTRQSRSMLIQGENFAGLSYLLKNGYEGKIDLIYIDPPFNTSQAFLVSSNRKNTISKPSNGTIVYEDKFTLEEYLEFIRERTVLIHKLLSEEGSLYFHIDTKMGHYCKIILDEIFGASNFKNDITRVKSNPKNFSRKAYGNEKDVILFYAKNVKKVIWNDVTQPLTEDEINRLYKKKDDIGRYTTVPLHAPGETQSGSTGMPWRGMNPPEGRHWRTDPSEFDRLDAEGMIEWSATGNPRIKKYAHDHKGKKIQDVWVYKDPPYPIYPTQKNEDMLKTIIRQSSTENSIILDCFAGSGTTLFAAEEMGRKWIGMDKSCEAIQTVKSRMPSNSYEYYALQELDLLHQSN